MLATINTLPHFQHEVIMAGLSDREKRPQSLVYHIARADQLYILLDDSDILELEEHYPEILDEYYTLTQVVDRMREIEDWTAKEAEHADTDE